MKELILDHDSESFIAGWYMEPDICDDLINEFEFKEQHTHFDKGRGYHRLASQYLEKSIHGDYMKELKKCVERYKKRYDWCHNQESEWAIVNTYNIQKYEPDHSYFKWHKETGGPVEGKMLRNLVFMTYLNDVNDGGTTEFLYQSLDIKPRKGLTLIWPAGWTHPHRGRPSKTEIKYIATGWCCYRHRC